MKQQTIDGLREFVAEGDGYYFLTPAEAADMIALYEQEQKAIAVEREACALIAEAGAISRCMRHQRDGMGACGIAIATDIRAR